LSSRAKEVQALEVETNPKTHLPRAECAGGEEEGIEKLLTLFGCCGRRERVEVYEFVAETKDGLVQKIVNFEHRPETHLLAYPEFTRDIEIQKELPRPLSGVARQISRLADCR
jgi:hypothetical protein